MHWARLCGIRVLIWSQSKGLPSPNLGKPSPLTQTLRASVSNLRDALGIKQNKVGATFSQARTELSFEVLDIKIILIAKKESGRFIS